MADHGDAVARQKFEAWYAENYLKISGTSSWVERAWAAYQAGSADRKRTIGKFSTDGVRIFNTVSGEAIPDDEPLFLLRARDIFALAAIDAYQFAAEKECNELHRAGIKQLRSKFKAFANANPDRMKQPGITRHLKLDPAPPKKEDSHE